MVYVDATCPLVSKVHIEAQRHADNGLQMIMIGHEGHPETVGTMGQLPDGEVLLVETVDDVVTVTPRDPAQLAYVTQTTLSVRGRGVTMPSWYNAQRISTGGRWKASHRWGSPLGPRPLRC